LGLELGLAMGCCGSLDKESAERLTAVEQEAKQFESATGSDGLTEIGKCAKELRDVFEDAVVQKGNMTIAGRVEDLSDVLVRNLTSRITVELLKPGAAEYKPVTDRIMAIASDLDAVRATKATKLVQNQLDRQLQTITAAQEKAVDPLITKIKGLHERLKQPGQEKKAAAGTKEILDLAAQAQSLAPEVKGVAKSLLEQLVGHAVWLLEVDAWAISAEGCEEVLSLAKRIDEMATKLTTTLGATWDPPITPQVEGIRDDRAKAACAQLLAEAEKQLKSDNGGAAYDCLQALLPWWPLLKSHSLEIVGLFSKMQTYASEAFLQATAEGQTSTAEEIRGFAVQFDELRGKFQGLPPVASGRPLGEVLETGEARVQASKALQSINAEIAKEKDDDDTTNLSLATTIQALESLVVAWPTATSSDAEELEKKMLSSCAALEAWTFEAVTKGPVNQVTGLLQFAAEYDGRRAKLPPEPAEALRPRLASEAATRFLQQADQELAKTSGMRANLLLESLKAAAAAIPGESGSPEARTVLLRVMAATQDRLLASFADVLTADGENEKKEVMLLKFAESADEVQKACSIDGMSLVEAMKQKRVETTEELTSRLDDQLSAGLSSVTDLCALARLCKKLQSTETQHFQRAAAVAEKFRQVAASQPSVAKEALQGIDGVLQALQDLGCTTDGFRDDLVSQASRSHLAAAQGERNPDALGRELQGLEEICRQNTVPPAVVEEIQKLVDELPKVMPVMMKEATKSGAAAVLDTGAVAEKLAVAVSRAEVGSALLSTLASAQKAVSSLELASAELQKSAGMNPRTVVGILKELPPQLQPLLDCPAYVQSTDEVVQQFKGKLQDACSKAQEAEASVREKKVAALLQLAKEGDAAQQALAELPGSPFKVDSFAVVILGFAAQKSLEAVEAELSKEKGMNPKAVLAGLQAVTKELSDLDPESSATVALRSRAAESCEKVTTRMIESLEDAVQASNEAKQKALLSFAKEFDTACSGLTGSSLEAELQTRARV